MKLHHPPLQLIEETDRTPEQANGFLTLTRFGYRLLVNGQASPLFEYDSVTRRAMDAVVIVAHFERDGEPWLYLRSSVRPPLAQRSALNSPVEEPGNVQLWELPAGLLEPEEAQAGGVEICAARETEEELGFRLAPSAFAALGHSVFPLAGVIAERQFFAHVRVDPNNRIEPSLDGSVLESAGQVAAVPLAAALTMIQRGQLPDSKSELGVRRFADLYPSLNSAGTVT